MQTSKVVRVNGLEVAFGDFKAVRGVTFDVDGGEIFGFLGANGAGKTTTIRVLCGLLAQTAGSVLVLGSDPARDPMAVKQHVGYMSQKFTLYRDMTIQENLRFAGELRHMEVSNIRSRIDELVAFIRLEQPMNTMVCDLPGGVLQQVSLVAATIHDPEIVFLDEPTAGVTPAARARFWELIKQMSGVGKTVFVTTHYMDEAEQCDRIALMRSGELIALDSPSGLKRSTFPEPIYEMTPSGDVRSGWQDGLTSSGTVYELQTFGMRYHARVKSEEAFKDYCSRNLKGYEVNRIQPSLEDVFIRLVEGQNR